MQAIPYWRLSGFYFCYFASWGVLVPYWSLYLQACGFDIQAIGELTAVVAATKIVAPNIWSWLADYTERHMLLVRINSFLATLLFIGVLFDQSYGWLVLVMVSFSFFWNAALPQVETVTFAYLGTQHHRYSLIRLWGSIGFILTVSALGWFFTHYSVIWLPFILGGWLATIVLFALVIPEKTVEYPHSSAIGLWEVLRNPSVIALFIVCFLMQVSHAPYYTFYSIYLEAHGYKRAVIGQLWGLGVIAEVVMFMVMHRLLIRFPLRHLLILSVLLTAIRWLLIGYYIEWTSILLFAQLLHAASFSLFHGVSIQFIHRYFPGRLRGRGQALYSSLSFGAGSAVGSWISGYTWANLGASISYTLATLVCGCALWVTWQGIQERIR